MQMDSWVQGFWDLIPWKVRAKRTYSDLSVGLLFEAGRRSLLFTEWCPPPPKKEEVKVLTCSDVTLFGTRVFVDDQVKVELLGWALI